MALKQIRMTPKGGDLPNSLFTGQVYTMEEAAADAYVAGGFAEYVEEAKAPEVVPPEAAVIEPPENAMMAKPRSRKAKSKKQG